MSTPNQALVEQHRIISLAINLLQSDLDNMTNSINPESKSWADVSKFAHVASMAKSIVDRYEQK